MKASEIAIRNHVFTWMIMAGLILFGTLSFLRMGVSQFPDVDFPYVNIRINYEGAAPEVMEKDIIEPVESAVVAVQGIRRLSSSARNGSAGVSVEFDLDKDIDTAVQEIQTQLARAARNLPDEVDPPVVTKSNPEDRPLLWLTVSSDKIPVEELMPLVRDRIRDQFTTVAGVSEIMLGGYVEPSLRIDLNSAKLTKYDLTVDDILTSIEREHIELPAGRIEAGDVEEGVRVYGEARDVEEFRNLYIKRRGGGANFVPIRLRDVATINEGLADVRRKSRVSGKPAVGLGILKQRGANAVQVAARVKAKVADIQKQLPPGVDISVANDQARFIEESVDELVFTLALSAGLTALVCWLFLGSWSSTMNVILAIPTSVIGSFIILYALGFTLNTFTLLGLSLAIGIIVDDAIIVLENIIRHAEMGKSRLKAALDGSAEITFAVLATTAAIIAIFLPVAFMEGLIGKFFFQFGVTIAVAVALSCVEALTLAPMRCSQFLSHAERRTFVGRGMEGMLNGLSRAYARSLKVLLNYRLLVIGVSLAIFAGSLIFAKYIDKEFSPSQDESSIFIRVQTKEGASLNFTDRMVKDVEKLVMELPEFSRYFANVGGFGGGQVNTANVFVTLKDPKDRPKDEKLGRSLSQQEVADKLRPALKEMKDLKAFIQNTSGSIIGGGRGFPVEFSIRGPDWQTLMGVAEKFEKAMEGAGIYTDIRAGDADSVPEVQVIPDRHKALLMGVEIAEISRTIQVLLGGTTAGFYSRGGQRYDVRVQLEDNERDALEDINRIHVKNNRGVLVPLKDLVTLKRSSSPQTISREERVRAISLSANHVKEVSQAKALTKVEELAKEVLPQGYYIVMSGSSETFRESSQSLVFVFILGILIAYMVLASQFNSFIDPVIVLLALPFSISGAFLCLYLTGQTINIYSMIGIILLMGIVKKNSILLVEFTNHLRADGRNINAALLEACPLRLRPILMTSIATIAAAVPGSINFGPGAETRIPMSVVIIGGVTVSTFFTLFVVPCFYSLVKREAKQEVAGL